MRTAILIAAAIAFSGATIALADPPTAPQKPERWEFIGTYQIGEGAGLESINAVIDLDSITRDGTIVHVYVGRDFTEVNGQWVPTYRNDDGSLGAGSMIVSYQIDCKYHTYNELWFETDLGYQEETEDDWIRIEPDNEVALAERRLCR